MLLAAPTPTANAPVVPSTTSSQPRKESPQQHLQRLLARIGPDPNERRNTDRRSLSVLMRLTPLDARNGSKMADPDESITVVGKDFSPRGIGMYHQERLPHRFVELAIDDPQMGSVVLEIELTWCRYTKQGWYESGGRVLSCVEAKSAA